MRWHEHVAVTQNITKSNDDHVWACKEETAWTGKTAVACVEKWARRITQNDFTVSQTHFNKSGFVRRSLRNDNY